MKLENEDQRDDNKANFLALELPELRPFPLDLEDTFPMEVRAPATAVKESVTRARQPQ